MSVYERVNDNTDLGDLYHVLEKLLVSSDFFNQLKNEPRYFIMPDFTEDLEELLRSVGVNNEIFESDAVATLREACVDFRECIDSDVYGYQDVYKFDFRNFESKLTEVYDMLKPLVTYCLIRNFMVKVKLEVARLERERLEAAKLERERLEAERLEMSKLTVEMQEAIGYKKANKTTEQLNTVVNECVQAAALARGAVTEFKSMVLGHVNNKPASEENLDYVNNKPASEENLDNLNIENVNEDLREAYDMANRLHMMANAIKDKESVNKQSDNAKRKKKSNRRK